MYLYILNEYFYNAQIEKGTKILAEVSLGLLLLAGILGIVERFLKGKEMREGEIFSVRDTVEGFEKGCEEKSY